MISRSASQTTSTSPYGRPGAAPVLRLPVAMAVLNGATVVLSQEMSLRLAATVLHYAINDVSTNSFEN